MPTFVYNALDSGGKAAQGTLTADSRVAAMDEVARLGLMPMSLEASEGQVIQPTARLKTGRGWAGRHVSGAQIDNFTRELANLLGAGVPLGRALSILRRESSQGAAAKEQWSAIHDDVVGGKPLADAMARWNKSFPPVFIAMVRAGETGGFLDVVLMQIADFRAREKELLGKVKSALVYPAVLAALAVCVLIFLLTFFIPRFTSIFANLGGTLPLLTRIIIRASHIATHDGLFVLIAVAGLVILTRRGLKSERGRRAMERAFLGTPLLGTALARFALVRFARMLGTLIESGVPLIRALEVSREAIGNQTLADTVSDALGEVKRGSSLSRALARSPRLFPPSVVEMVAVAEESGRLDKELIRMAQTYEMELDRRLRMLVSLAEPAMLFVMAALVGTIVVGMLLPIFMLQELIK